MTPTPVDPVDAASDDAGLAALIAGRRSAAEPAHHRTTAATAGVG
jgi:hypothetical protein